MKLDTSVTGQKLELKPITRNGGNKVERIFRASKTWDRKTWKVMRHAERVSFSPRRGPWVLVEPLTIPAMPDMHRWVSLTDDADFDVTITSQTC